MQKNILHYLGVICACLLAAGSINLFLIPHHLISGGLTGIGIISYYLAGLPAGTVSLALNIPLLIAAYKLLGRRYLGETLFGTVMFSVCLDSTRFLADVKTTDDILLAAIFGGVFCGIAYGCLFRLGANSGGLDIAAAIVKKYYSLNMGAVIFGLNCLITAGAAVFFGPAPAMYTMVSMFINGRVTDKIVAGFNNRKAVIIISNHPEAIADGIINQLERGATYLDGAGAFIGDKKRIVFCAVRLTEMARLKAIVNATDPSAFMIILDANEVAGRGFTLPVEVTTDARQKGDKRLIGSFFDSGE